MKLWEILTEAAGIVGYWKVKEENGVRRWIPEFGKPKKDAILPFGSRVNAPREQSTVKGHQAYDLVPGKNSRNDLNARDRKLLRGLEDALKRRSDTDTISDEDFNKLLDKCTSTIIGKLNLRKQTPQRLFMTTPASSSGVANAFAQRIQKALNIPDNQMFLGHFTKRDAIEILLDVEDDASRRSPSNKKGLTDSDRQQISDRMYASLDKKEDTELKMKDIRRGHRSSIVNARIPLFNMRKDIKLSSDKIPYLLIVDDNVQTGATANSIAQVFVKNTGVTPNNVLSLAMFKYI